MLQDLLINLAAAGVAFVLGVSARSIRTKAQQRKKQRKLSQTQHQRRPDFAVDWIIDYYQRRNRLDELFRIRLGEREVFIPFITSSDWQVIDQDEDLLLEQEVPHEHSQVEVDRRVVASRLADPEEIDSPTVWNDLHACAKSVMLTPNGPRISVLVGEYFQYITVCGALEDETYAAVMKPGRRTPIRDKHMSSLAQAAKCGMGAHSIGMTVALVFRQGDVLKVLIQERSHAVSTYGGGLGVVPMFGCQTLDLSDRTTVSLIHNYLREVYEELYGGHSVQQPNPRVDPRWFLDEPEMKYMVDKTTEGGLSLRLLGFGFDAINGQLIIGGLTEVKDESFAESQLTKLIGNWEIRNIHVWDLFGEQLADALLAQRFTPACAFTLTQTRELLSRELANSVD